MNNEYDEMLTALGALAETCGYLKHQLLKNRFSEKETLYLVGKYLMATVSPTNFKEDN